MLDKRTLKLLDILNSECDGLGYKVFSLLDLSISFPEHLKTDQEGVRESLLFLSSHEYISVKYEDEKEICLRPLSKGRLLFENRLDDEIERGVWGRKYLAFSLVGAFFGGVTATLFSVAIFFLFGGKL